MTCFRSFSWGVILFFVAGANLPAAEIPPFTIDSVLESLRATHPEASRVADALPPGVEAHENLTYARRPQGELKLDLYRPASKAILPVVIIVHGGGWVAGDRTMERPFAKNLAARGYVAVPVSYRLGAAGRFPAPILDLKESIRWLRAHAADFGLDPQQVGAVGGSAGATLVTMLAVSTGSPLLEEKASEKTQSDRVQAVVNIDGTVTFLDNRLIQISETEPSPYWEYVHGVYSRNRETWLAASPLYYTDRESAPVLFIKSTATQPVLAGRDEMRQRLKLFGIDSPEIQLPNTPHPFWLVHPWFQPTLDAAELFLRRHLKKSQSAGEAVTKGAQIQESGGKGDGPLDRIQHSSDPER